jgi:glucose-6-phosphate dehydrogenase assembly protein OpcA
LSVSEAPWSMSPSALAGAPMSPVIARIERELREIWAAPVLPGEAPKTRVCTMNLVVVAGNRTMADRYTGIVDEVTGSIPGRAIVVALEPDSPAATLDGDATAVGAGGGESQGVFSERVRLTATGSTCARVASAVESLCVPEIPTTLVWLGRVHVDDPVFLALANTAQRVILDTEYTSLGSLMKLAAWARAEEGRPAVADLAWTRLAVWQELCARFFDDPNMRDHAQGVTRLTLSQASEPGTRLGSEGSLLLGWVATRLGWKVQRLGGAMRFRRPDGGQVALTLSSVARPQEVAPAALAGLTLEAESGGVKAIGSINRDLASGMEGKSPDADMVLWKLDVPLPTATEQRVRLRDNKGGKLLVRTLHRPVSDPTLSEAVAFAEQIYEDGLICT